jgi:cytolysin (calcineurin-like family phosphatase)
VIFGTFKCSVGGLFVPGALAEISPKRANFDSAGSLQKRKMGLVAHVDRVDESTPRARQISDRDLTRR